MGDKLDLYHYYLWRNHFLVSRRNGEHALAAELAGVISLFWIENENFDESRRWSKKYEEEMASLSISYNLSLPNDDALSCHVTS